MATRCGMDIDPRLGGLGDAAGLFRLPAVACGNQSSDVRVGEAPVATTTHRSGPISTAGNFDIHTGRLATQFALQGGSEQKSQSGSEAGEASGRMPGTGRMA